ncbi:MAG: DUF4373 domain-containing protein, partial [Candidatus Omnitrophica bacterium]|nr:DUF4373 domain-containing protein [Candidatus Omnitrophota bacterium]
EARGLARPLKEGMDYFPHDTDASNDEKIEAIRALHGNDGYAFYFILCERIYRSPNSELDISKKAVAASLIKKVGVSPDKFEEILQTAFEVELFCREAYEERQVLTSKGIKKRAGEVKKLRERWRKQKEFHAENPAENREENAEETGERKEKKRKENKKKNKSKENKEIYGDFVALTPTEYSKLVDELGTLETQEYIERLNDYAHQKPGKFKEYKSHYHTIKNWHRKDQQNGNARDAPSKVPRGFQDILDA